MRHTAVGRTGLGRTKSFAYPFAILSFLLIAYPAAVQAQRPTIRWGKEGSPPFSQIWHTLVAFDSAGGVVTVGGGIAIPDGAPQGSPMVAAQIITRHRPDGTVLWTNKFIPENSIHASVTVDGVALDSASNVYVLGTLYTPASSGGPNEDIILQKIDSRGRRAWIARFDADDSDTSVDEATGLVLDGQGGVTVAGTSDSGDGMFRRSISTAHFDAQGVRTWSARYSEPQQNITATAIASDRAGGVYVVGTAHEGRFSAPLAVRYNSEGNLVWKALPGSKATVASGLSSWVVGAVVDKQGSVYVLSNALDGPDTFTCTKFSRDGVELWSLEEKLKGNQLMASSIALYPTGGVVIGSTVYNGRSAYGATLISADGMRRWTSFRNASHTEMLVSSGLGVDTAGNVYATGLSYAKDGETRIQVTVKFDPTGKALWRFNYGGGRKLMIELPGMAVRADQALVLTGLTGHWAVGHSGAIVGIMPATYVLK